MSKEDERFLDKKKFRRIKSNQLVEQLSRGLLAPKEIDDKGNAGVTFGNTKTNFWLGISNYNEINKGDKHWKVPNLVPKLLDFILMGLCEKNCEFSNLEQSLIDFAETIGKYNDISGTRKGVKLALDILKNLIFQWQNIGSNEFNEITIIEAGEIRKNTIKVQFSDDLVNRFRNTKSYLYVPLEIYKFSDRNNINSYLLAKRILFHHYRNINNSNADVITVEDLYKNCSTLPSIEALKLSNGAFTKRIIRAFERDLNNCCNIFNWSYLGYEESEYRNFPSEWLKEKICISWNSYFIK